MHTSAQSNVSFQLLYIELVQYERRSPVITVYTTTQLMRWESLNRCWRQACTASLTC